MLMNRRLYRSRTDTVLGGVAAGLATYLNTDPALVRIAWAILVPITGGAAFLAYIVAWIVIPEEPARTARVVDPVVGSDAEGTVLPADEPPGYAAAAGERADEVAWTEAEPAPRGGDSRAGLIVGIGLVLLGVWFLVRQYLPPIDWGLIWPVVLIGIGGLILVTTSRGRDGR
jgi:phage shock protein C